VTLAFNARMYSVNASAKADWNRLLGWAVQRAGLDWQALDHDPPAPLSTLWSRSDLGLVMMCGLPFALSRPRPRLIAAPLPAAPRYGGRPVYCSDFIVRAESANASLKDCLGGVLAYTMPESMSGGVAPYHHLAQLRRSLGGRRLFSGVLGELLNGRGVIEAVAQGRADVGTLDSYFLELLQQHEPAFAAQVRVVDSTAMHPIPPLVATAALSDRQFDALRAALLAAGATPELAPVLLRLRLRGFAVADACGYEPLAVMAAALDKPFGAL